MKLLGTAVVDLASIVQRGIPSEDTSSRSRSSQARVGARAHGAPLLVRRVWRTPAARNAQVGCDPERCAHICWRLPLPPWILSYHRRLVARARLFTNLNRLSGIHPSFISGCQRRADTTSSFGV
eukprot:2083501-Pleurochrysis_carterae.AAC.2